MSSDVSDQDDLRRAIRDARARFQQLSEAERRDALQRAVQQALEAELAEERQQVQREAAAVREELTRDTAEETAQARRRAPSRLLLLLLILLVILFIAAATGQIGRIFPGLTAIDASQPALLPTFPPSLNPTANPTAAPGPSPAADSGISVAASRATATPSPAMLTVDPLFQSFYNTRGAEPIFGRPISPLLDLRGRQAQWFERARLEYWPENQGTPFEIQPARLGAEYAASIEFPDQAPFESRPGLRYFPETRHGVGGQFLAFWEQFGGLTIFGYPISDEIQETLADGQIYTVQYFERARLEYHPQYAGTPDAIQVGALGHALYGAAAQPQIISLVRPTPVPPTP